MHWNSLVITSGEPGGLTEEENWSSSGLIFSLFFLMADDEGGYEGVK